MEVLERRAASAIMTGLKFERPRQVLANAGRDLTTTAREEQSWLSSSRPGLRAQEIPRAPDGVLEMTPWELSSLLRSQLHWRILRHG